MEKKQLLSFMNVDLRDKVVLVRVDHNVVKKGKVKDTMRIDATFPTLLHIYRKGGKPIFMTHVGRPYDKKSGTITVSEDDSVQPIVDYLKHKLSLQIEVPKLRVTDADGITDLSELTAYVAKLKKGEMQLLYLPNTRWFKGEETKDEAAETLAMELSRLADVFINDAFGSWQPHVSTYGVTQYLPSYAGLLMEKEVAHLEEIFSPQRPFVAVVAGAKFDTKIGSLTSLLKMSDKLILGGVLYNAYLAAKYDISINGLSDDDIALARKFLEEAGPNLNKLVELPYIVESDSMDSISEGSFRTRKISELTPGTKLNYVLDIGAESFQEHAVRQVISEAGTIFVNAVMGYTTLFKDGSQALYSLVNSNATAGKLFGGGDTIDEFKNLLPQVWLKAANDPSYYFFTGGGAILDAIEQGSPYAMKTVQALLRK